MQRITIHGDVLTIGRYFAVSFQRTVRVPHDGGIYPRPAELRASRSATSVITRAASSPPRARAAEG